MHEGGFEFRDPNLTKTEGAYPLISEQGKTGRWESFLWAPYMERPLPIITKGLLAKIGDLEYHLSFGRGNGRGDLIPLPPSPLTPFHIRPE